MKGAARTARPESWKSVGQPLGFDSPRSTKIKLNTMKAKGKVNKPLEEAIRLVWSKARRQNACSMQQGLTGCGATTIVYVREDLVNRLRKNPQLASFAIPACEFEQYGKTLAGRSYVSAHRWRKCSLESLFE